MHTDVRRQLVEKFLGGLARDGLEQQLRDPLRGSHFHKDTSGRRPSTANPPGGSTIPLRATPNRGSSVTRKREQRVFFGHGDPAAHRRRGRHRVVDRSILRQQPSVGRGRAKAWACDVRDRQKRRHVLGPDSIRFRIDERTPSLGRDERTGNAAGHVVRAPAARWQLGVENDPRVVARLDDLVQSSEALESRIETVEAEHDAARRAAASVRVRVAVALAGQREGRVRAIGATFAMAKREWHQVAQAAADAHHEATGQVGVEPVPHTAFRAALLMTNFDDGLRIVFARQGLSEALQPMQIRGLTEHELLQIDYTADAPDCVLQGATAATRSGKP
jgi:hypothetical protein